MPKKSSITPRKMMELAVQVMKKSVHEPREDDKISPFVGAVLVMSDGKVDTAARGELREGNHAEFTLLERKHIGDNLQGARMFVTLEPCAPGSRKKPKKSCAERIVDARITEVWFGIEDPDPTVDRQGLRYLEQNGVKVHVFDRDLQDEIRVANEAFIAQALERASVARSKVVQPKPQSAWDEALPLAELRHLSATALKRYGEKAEITSKVKTKKFNEVLQQHGLFRRHGTVLRPTGFGFILFGNKPRYIIHHAGLAMTLEYPDGSYEIKDFDGPGILIPDAVQRWLKRKLPSVIDNNQMTRRIKPALPYDMVREAIINALVHRDYDLDGATCHIFVKPDRVQIRSPGLPLPPVTMEQLQTFNAPMYNRNPKLQFAFGGTRLVEGRGLGMRTLSQAASKHGLPLPKYDFDGVYLNLTIFRNVQAAAEAVGEDILDQLSEAEKAGWEWLVSKGGAKSEEYEKEMGVNYRTALNHLNKFLKLGLLEKTGSARATKYRVRN